jgi:isopenicillin N synthase-like dioxygenase
VPSTVPVIDLTPWFDGGAEDRAGVARQVDAALRTSGFLLITGHRVPAAVRAQTRATAREFFALPAEAKARYAITVGGRGWIPPGAEANGYAEGTATPPDLKESFSLAADQPTGNRRGPAVAPGGHRLHQPDARAFGRADVIVRGGPGPSR